MRYALMVALLLQATQGWAQTQAQLDAKLAAEDDLTATWSAYGFMDDQFGQMSDQRVLALNERAAALADPNYLPVTFAVAEGWFDIGEDGRTAGNTKASSGNSAYAAAQATFANGMEQWNNADYSGAVSTWSTIDADTFFAQGKFDAAREDYQQAKADYQTAREYYYNSYY